ncbi:hypothetical protein ZWY2020_011684 [Hordeum vulgare]|nr:hypothetical protein ZWY2020_011684 [Hordeum vulgare]
MAGRGNLKQHPAVHPTPRPPGQGSRPTNAKPAAPATAQVGRPPNIPAQAGRPPGAAGQAGDSRTAHANRLQPRGRWGDDGVNAYGDGQHRGSSSSGGDRGYAWQNNGASGNGFIALPGKFVPGTSGPTHLKRGGLRLNWASRGGGRKPRPPLPTQESSTDLDESTLATATEPVKEVADPAMADHSLAIAKGDGEADPPVSPASPPPWRLGGNPSIAAAAFPPSLPLLRRFQRELRHWLVALMKLATGTLCLDGGGSRGGGDLAPDGGGSRGGGSGRRRSGGGSWWRRDLEPGRRPQGGGGFGGSGGSGFEHRRCRLRNTEMKIVLWGQRAIEFEAQLIYDNGQETAVVGVFVGLLMKSYKNDETLSGGSACRWYLNEDLPEIDDYFERFRLCMEGTDGTAAAEFVFFNRVAQQLVGKSVMSLLRSSGLPREIAAVVSQKYTLAISVTQKSLSQRNISFQPLRNLKGKILLLPLTAAVQPFQHHPWNHQLSRVLTALHMVDQKSS